MSIGFYELLQVTVDASPDAIRGAYQEQVAIVVRKLRAAEARQQDVAPVEARRAALAEAWGVLSDPTRRRRYDRFRELSRDVLPSETDDLWAKAGPSLVDSAAAAALEVVRTLTDMNVGEPVVAPTPPPPQDVEDLPFLLRPDAPPPATPPAIAMPTGPAETKAPRAAAAPLFGTAPALELDRTVPSEDLARLLDQYGPTGAFLHAVRDLRRIPQAQLSANTRISQRFIDGLERDAYTDLPGATFVRGYLKMVIRALEAIPAGPEMDEFIEGYMARFHRARG